MKKLIEKTKFWLNCARAYSLPITILNWLVIFIYSLLHNGSVINGILALIGISFAHLATNLTDDYLDYKILIKNEKYINSAQNCKCAYIKSGAATTTQFRNAIIICLAIAAIIGAVLFFSAGAYVAVLAICGLIVALCYQRMSICGLGDIAVIIAFGPLLFEGVYYVMTKSFSVEVLLLSLGCAFLTNSILYVHMLMDFDGDECSHKTTLCTKFKTKDNALKFLLFFYIAGFMMTGMLAYMTRNYLYFITWLTIPLIEDLYQSLKIYNQDKTNVPKIYPWHKPLDNWELIKNTPDAPFYFRFFFARNIMTYFMLLTCIAIIFGKNLTSRLFY